MAVSIPEEKTSRPEKVPDCQLLPALKPVSAPHKVGTGRGPEVSRYSAEARLKAVFSFWYQYFPKTVLGIINSKKPARAKWAFLKQMALSDFPRQC